MILIHMISILYTIQILHKMYLHMPFLIFQHQFQEVYATGGFHQAVRSIQGWLRVEHKVSVKHRS